MILGGPSGDVSIAQLREVVQSSTYRSSLGMGRLDALSGQYVDREEAMGLPPFWAGVMLLAKTAGTLPLEVCGDGRDATELELRLGVQPNVDTPSSVFWTTLFTHLIPTHNAFALKLPASDGIDAPELFLLEPEFVEKYRGKDREIRYDIYTREGGEFAMGVHGRHVIHFRGPALHSTFRPESMISVARNSLGNALATQEYQGAMYRNGGVPKGVLSVDEPLSLEQGLEMADAWRAAYGGSENAGKIAVLDRGGKFQTVGMTNDNAQFIQQLQMSATDAARLLNLPPALIGAEGASLTYANASHNDNHFLKFSMRPWLDLVEGPLAIDVDLCGVRSPLRPRFNTDEITRPDQAQRYLNYQTAIASGWMEANDARVAEGLTPLDAEVASATQVFGYHLESGAVTLDDVRLQLGLDPWGGEMGAMTVPQYKAHIEGLSPGTADADEASGTDAATRSEREAMLARALAPNITINQPPVNVQPAPVHVAATQVDVHVPEQPVPNVQVDVAAPNVQVDVAAPNVQVDVAAPDVRVEPQITVEPAPVSQGEKKIAFTRNKLGNIIDATITEDET